MSSTDNGNAEAIPKDGYRMARNCVASNGYGVPLFQPKQLRQESYPMSISAAKFRPPSNSTASASLPSNTPTKDSSPPTAPILKNLYSILKPGGYLQWFDTDHRKASIDAAKPGLKQTGGEGYIKHLNGLQNFDWTSPLSAHFANTGFTSISDQLFAAAAASQELLR
ncbi:hypothetical protein LPUS_02806 [Lasallia pustulata]|uniref:Uncharacterized protein n=1 Tax=Lasallia pustulata TaxID=136370 RepID=A0A1W5CTL5_9LECA|nr:hypothetical protein LPUS_02806 [Lasallia pustulata]